MSSTERRQAIANALVRRRQDTMANLAAEFGVSRRTIVSDITALTCSLPIESRRGRFGGGVKLADWYRPHRSTLSPEQGAALRRAAERAEEADRRLLLSVLSQFSVDWEERE